MIGEANPVNRKEVPQMALATLTGLGRATAIYQNREQRVRELKAEGKTVVGYLCIYPAIEMLTALDLVPFRMFGDMDEPITSADDYLPTIVCPFLRSLLDLGLKGKYDFLDGVVMAHICDVGARISNIWNVGVKTPYSYFIDVPHTNRKLSQERLRDLLNDFKKSLEAFTGKTLTDEKLKRAVEKHNRQRALVRELYNLRKPDPPLISGVETLQVMMAVMITRLRRQHSARRKRFSEVRETKERAGRKYSARLLRSGAR